MTAPLSVEAEMDARKHALTVAAELVATQGSPANHTVFLAADFLVFLRTGEKPAWTKKASDS